MKRIILTIATAIVSFAFAPAYAQVSLGAGYLNSTDVVKIGEKTSTDPLNGFYVGAGYTLPLAHGLSFTPGIYYGFATKASSTDLIITTVSGKREDHFINIPLSLNYGVNVGSGLKLFAFAGPSLSVGVVSKVTGSIGDSSSSYDRYKENSDLNRFDLMIGGGIGCDVMEKVRIHVGYDFGLLNRYKSTDAGYHRNQLTAGVAYLF